MTESLTSISLPPQFPDHTQLPESDGTFVKNFQEHPQSILLTESIWSVLEGLNPDGQFCVGQDSGIYWRLTDPPERGAEAPDWFYVSNVPPLLNGEMRRSYVLWRELIAPLLILEFASGDGSEERDKTPWTGKFWIYEQVIRPAFYGIYEVNKASVEVYRHVENHFELLTPNDRGHYEILPLQAELGIWQGTYKNVNLPWLRWWDLQGKLLLTGQEAAELERQEKEQALEHLDQERQEKEQALDELDQERLKRQQLAEKLRSLTPEQLAALGIDSDALQ